MNRFSAHMRLVFHKWCEIPQLYRLYRKEPSFLLFDLKLFFAYLLSNPYKLARGAAPFGSTPLSTYAKMARAFGFKKRSDYLELGSGTGRGALWYATHLDMKVRGIDLSPEFTKRARAANHPRAQFSEEDILNTDLRSADIIYFYNTAFDNEFMEAFIMKLTEIKPGALLITISAPLRSKELYLYKRLEVTFPWGKTFAYCHRKG